MIVQHTPHWKRALAAFFVVIVVAGALYSLILFFDTVRAIVARTQLPFAETVVQASTKPDVAPPEDVSLPAVVGRQERVNILLLGIDQREGDAGPWRTDTMILLSLDPATQSAAMLSIPRDLWVTIPGYGENRINAAHMVGDKQDYPGGGPALAKKTVWHTLGAPVHGYVRINFSGFERLVDAIGGLTITVDKPIHDEAYPDGNYGTMVVDIPAGEQQMDGKTALQYARSRHGTGDFDRMARQQKVILAARDKVMSLDIPLSRLPEMIAIAGDSLKTDLTVDQMLSLAEMARNIDTDAIHHGVIDSSMTTTVLTPEGWMVEVPDWVQVRDLVDNLFPAAVPALPTPAVALSQLESEGARIVVHNGTLVTDLAHATADELTAKGYNVVSYDNADRFDYAETLIVLYSAKPYTAQALAAHLGVPERNIRQAEAPDAAMDILVIVGRDYAQKGTRN